MLSSQWHETYGKPVMVTEYGGDTVAGLHSLPGLMFTEEWQVEMLRQGYLERISELFRAFNLNLCMVAVLNTLPSWHKPIWMWS